MSVPFVESGQNSQDWKISRQVKVNEIDPDKIVRILTTQSNKWTADGLGPACGPVAMKGVIFQ